MDHHRNRNRKENEEEEEEVEIPSYFLCPISLEIMRDPVTLSTGITYDRESIEQWILSAAGPGQGGQTYCPVTKQPLIISSSDDLTTPNHTLRRLIQSWCTLNASYGVERFPTPKPPISKSHIAKIISSSKSTSISSHGLINNIVSLRSLALESLANRRTIGSVPGVIEFLISVIVEHAQDAAAVDLSLAVLHLIIDSSDHLLPMLLQQDRYYTYTSSSSPGRLVESLSRVLTRSGGSNEESQAFALELIKNLLETAQPVQLAALKPDFFAGLVRVLRDVDEQHCYYSSSSSSNNIINDNDNNNNNNNNKIIRKSHKDALRIMVRVCPWGNNRISAVQAGAVWALVDLLLLHHAHVDNTSRRLCEMAMVALDQLCGCADGRADLIRHKAGLAVVSKKILRVSNVATDRAVRILLHVARFSSNKEVVRDMVEFGVVAKLCLVLQVDCDRRTKDKCKEILSLHATAWKTHPCIPKHLRASYPAPVLP